MSYAAGVVSSRYVTLLRQRQEAAENSEGPSKTKERTKKEKERE